MSDSSVRAVVLRVTDHGEGHRLVDLLTLEHGLLRTFAPSAQRSRRRFGGALEPGTRISAVIRRRPGKDMANLLEATVQGGLRGAIRDDLSAMLRAGWMLDLGRSILGQEQPHEEVYDLLTHSLEILDAGRLPAWGLVAFEIAALSAYGARPRFDACCRCGKEPRAERSRFSPMAGGLLCPTCSPGWGPGDLALTSATLRALDALADAGPGSAPLRRAEGLPEALPQIEEAREALRGCTENLLGRPLKSRGILDRLDDPPRASDPPAEEDQA